MIRPLRVYGEYYLPARNFNSKQLDEFLKLNENLKKISMYATSVGLRKVLSEHGFSLGIKRRIAFLDLTMSIEELWKNMDRKRRNGIRYAIKKGVAIHKAKLEDLEAFKKVWVGGYKKKYGIKRKYDIRSWIENEQLFIAKLNNKAIAGTRIRESVYRLPRDVVIYSANTSLREYQKFKPNDLLIWEIAKWAKKEGYREFNLAGGNLFKREFTKTGFVVVEEWRRW